MRERDRIWLDVFMEAVGQSGEVTNQEKYLAAVASDRTIAKTKTQKRQQTMANARFEVMVRKPEVRQAMREAFADVADFGPSEALGLLADHIRGRLKREVVVDGAVIELSVPPSLPALKVYLDMTIPAPVKEVHTRNEHLHASIRTATPTATPTGDGTAPPPQIDSTLPRAIGSVPSNRVTGDFTLEGSEAALDDDDEDDDEDDDDEEDEDVD